MEKTKKITKRDHFNALLKIEDVKSNAALVEFINHEIELLSNKSHSRGMTKTQKENESIKAVLLEELRNIGKPVTITEFQSLSEIAGNYQNQKISALLRQMSEVERVEVKGKAYFTVK